MIDRFSRAVVKLRIPILLIVIALMVPSILGFMKTRVNFDMLTYLPEDMETVIGQDQLMEDFGKGAFSFIIVEEMPDRDVSRMKEKIQAVDHVDTVIWYDTLLDLSIPKQLLPADVFDEFNTDHSTLMAIFFDSSTSADETLVAVEEVRKVAGENSYISGMSPLVTDLKELCEREEPIYVGIAVALALCAMMLLLDNYLIPIVFLITIGFMIVLNMGTNVVFGEISYITKALSAVLQLAVTMDYSIFLWHSYNEQQEKYEHRKDAMAHAISETMIAVTGSSITTVAGFVALCFMSYTLGMDLGLVMAKGVVFGVIGSVTVLPAMILVLDNPLKKAMHKSLLPDMRGVAEKILKIFPVIIVLFVMLILPAYHGYDKAKDEVYYEISTALPQDMKFAIANSKLKDDFNIATTHLILVDKDTSSKNVRKMCAEMEKVDGVKYVLGLENLLGPGIPETFIPDSIKEICESDRWKLMIINSEYKCATEEIDAQINSLNHILKKYDEGGMLIGEGPCTKDLIEVTDHDFTVVNLISIALVFLIIALVEKSISLPFILISVIELAIFINLGLPHYLGTSMPFIAPICISTIQLGATVDYAILLTTRYKTERVAGQKRYDAVHIALSTSIPSIIVSGMGLFAATFGVAIYSDIDLISSLCFLLARGAIISVVLVIFALPSLLMLFDKIVCRTTIGMKNCNE